MLKTKTTIISIAMLITISCNNTFRKISGTYICGCSDYKRIDFRITIMANHTYLFYLARGGEAGNDTIRSVGNWKSKHDTLIIYKEKEIADYYKIDSNKLVLIDSLRPERIFYRENN